MKRKILLPLISLFTTLAVLHNFSSQSEAQGQLLTSSGAAAGYRVHYIDAPDYLPGDPGTLGPWKIRTRNIEFMPNGTLVGNVMWDGQNGEGTPPPGGTFPWHREAFVYDIATDECYFVKDLVSIPSALTDAYPELYFFGGNNNNRIVGMLRSADGINPSTAIPILIDLNSMTFELLPLPKPEWVQGVINQSAGGAAINDNDEILIRFRSSDNSPSARGFLWKQGTEPELIEYPSGHANAGQPLYIEGPGDLNDFNSFRQFVGINELNEVFRMSFDSSLRSILYETSPFINVVGTKHDGVNESGSFTGRMSVEVVVQSNPVITEIREVPFLYTDFDGLQTLPGVSETWGMGHEVNDAHDVVGQLDIFDSENNLSQVYRPFIVHGGFVASSGPELHMLEGDVVPISLNPDPEDLAFWDASDGKNALQLSERLDIDGDAVGDYPMITGVAAVTTTSTTGRGRNKTTTTTTEERWFLLVPELLPRSTSYSSGDLELTIPDNDPTGVSDTIVVETGDDVEISRLTVSPDISHPRPADLQATLVGPDGTEVELSNVLGDNVVTTFDGTSTLGLWTLHVIDTRKKKTGTLHSWSMTVEY